jgi:P27 family predicted phage terminase small subunit
MKGRKPALKLIVGGNAPLKAPSVPSWLTDHAKAEWRRVAPVLKLRGVLGADMLATLESYCIAVGQVREAEETMQKEGRTVETAQGVKAHPAYRIQAGAMREARLLAAELGLTPHRRPGEAAKDGGDGWDADLLA